jgi:hypothetical protein
MAGVCQFFRLFGHTGEQGGTWPILAWMSHGTHNISMAASRQEIVFACNF